MKQITAIVLAGSAALFLSACGGGGSSSDMAIIPTTPAPVTQPTEAPVVTPTLPSDDIADYTVTEIPLRGSKNPSLLVNSTYKVSGGKQTYAKFIMNEDGFVMLGGGVGIGLYDASMNRIETDYYPGATSHFSSAKQAYLESGEYIGFLDNSIYALHKYFTIYAKHADLKYLPMPENTRADLPRRFHTLWVLELNDQKILSMDSSQSLSLYDDETDLLVTQTRDIIAETLSAGRYVIYFNASSYGGDLSFESSVE